MKFNRWIAFPLAAAAALAIGLGAFAATPPASGSTNYAQVFVNKLAGILRLTPAQAQDALKQAQLETVDQMLSDGKITKAQADTMKASINAGNGLGAIRGYGRGPGGFRTGGAVIRDLRTAEMKALAGALRMSASELQAQLEGGKSLPDLEQAAGVSDSSVKAAMKAAAKGVLDSAVKAGTITQAEADTLLARAANGFGFRHGLPRPAQTPAAYFPSA